MPIYLDTTGMTSIAIAVCDRCKMKKPYVDLRPDGNSPVSASVEMAVGTPLTLTVWRLEKPKGLTFGLLVQTHLCLRILAVFLMAVRFLNID